MAKRLNVIDATQSPCYQPSVRARTWRRSSTGISQAQYVCNDGRVLRRPRVLGAVGHVDRLVVAQVGYIPKALAFFGLVSAAWCVLCAFAYIVSPAFSQVVNLWWFDTPLAIFDIVLSFWLMFKGLRGAGYQAAPFAG